MTELVKQERGLPMKILTNENYFEDDEYMSVSAFKKLRHCEVAYEGGN